MITKSGGGFRIFPQEPGFEIGFERGIGCLGCLGFGSDRRSVRSRLRGVGGGALLGMGWEIQQANRSGKGDGHGGNGAEGAAHGMGPFDKLAEKFKGRD